jgi:hypothetical protein
LTSMRAIPLLHPKIDGAILAVTGRGSNVIITAISAKGVARPRCANRRKLPV